MSLAQGGSECPELRSPVSLRFARPRPIGERRLRWRRSIGAGDAIVKSERRPLPETWYSGPSRRQISTPLCRFLGNTARRAEVRTSWVIFIGQKCGPYIQPTSERNDKIVRIASVEVRKLSSEIAERSPEPQPWSWTSRACPEFHRHGLPTAGCGARAPPACTVCGRHRC